MSQRDIDRIAIYNAIACKRVGVTDWLPYEYTAGAGVMLIRGCKTTKFLRGPRKGETKFLTKEHNITTAVTGAEVDEAERQVRQLAAFEKASEITERLIAKAVNSGARQ